MSCWLDDINRALDNTENPIQFFFRNDDAGWADQELFHLLDCFFAAGLPIDLAVIPKAITSCKAAHLYHYISESRGLIGIHQHGYNHINHQMQGRKCEFGSDRSYAQQQSDIISGMDLLNDYFADCADPIFTPPWNRCSHETADILISLGFRILSRDNTAQQLGYRDLQELPINIDWFKKYKGTRLTPSELGTVIGSAIKNDVPVGIMLHHKIMDENERNRLNQLLELLSRHSMAHCKRMIDLMTAR